MDEIIVALNARLLALLVTLYLVEPFTLRLVADLAFFAVLLDHLFAYSPRQFDTQVLPRGDVTQTVGDGVERTLAKAPLVDIEELPGKYLANAVCIVTP